MKEPVEKPHFHVTAAVIWKDGKVLIAQRPEGSHLGGYWEFPGGKQERNETLKECLVREVEEELGLKVEPIDTLMTVDHDYGQKRVSLHFFNCVAVEGEPKSLQCQRFLWAEPGELARFNFPPPDYQLIHVLSLPERERSDDRKRFG